MLVGTNSVEALEPKGMISSRKNGPNVVKTILVCFVVESLSCTSEGGNKIKCNRVSVIEARSQNLKNIIFAMKTKWTMQGSKIWGSETKKVWWDAKS